jgi:hypothetical protein
MRVYALEYTKSGALGIEKVETDLFTNMKKAHAAIYALAMDIGTAAGYDPRTLPTYMGVYRSMRTSDTYTWLFGSVKTSKHILKIKSVYVK